MVGGARATKIQTRERLAKRGTEVPRLWWGKWKGNLPKPPPLSVARASRLSGARGVAREKVVNKGTRMKHHQTTTARENQKDGGPTTPTPGPQSLGRRHGRADGKGAKGTQKGTWQKAQPGATRKEDVKGA